MKYIAAIAAALFWYPVFAFVSLEPNPANWDQSSRAVLVAFSIYSVGLALFLLNWRND